MRVPRCGGKPNTKGGRCCLCGVPLTEEPLLLLLPLLLLPMAEPPLPDVFWRQEDTGLPLTALGLVIVVGEAEPIPDVD